jgi:hypothetical protein
MDEFSIVTAGMENQAPMTLHPFSFNDRLNSERKQFYFLGTFFHYLPQLRAS